MALSGDDDPIKRGGVRSLIEGARRGYALTVFNSLPVNDGLNSKDDRIVLQNGLSMNRQLGMFHASFLGNLLINRKTWDEVFEERFLQSDYTHLCVALKILRRAPGLFIKESPFCSDDTLRDLNKARPFETGIDMALIQTELVLDSNTSRREVWKTYAKLVRSIPRAVLNRRCGWNPKQWGGPFKALTPRNLLRCYQHSLVFQLIAVAAWAASWLLPLPILRFLFLHFR